MSNRLDRNHRQIIYQSHLFLQKRFSVLYASQHPIESRHRRDALADLRIGREVAPPGFLVSELRFVSVNGFQPGLELVSNIDYKCGPNVVIERGVNDFERTMRTADPLRICA